MNYLPDLAWNIIIQNLNLNHRAPLRLVSKRIRDLCDSIQFSKLVICERGWLLPGVLEHKGEPYGVGETANVLDLNLFFSSPIIKKQMEAIETLVVHGQKEIAVEITSSFRLLTHLELHDLLFTDLTVLSSPELQTLVLNRVSHIWTRTTSEQAIEALERRTKKPRSILFGGLDIVKSKNIKYFWTDQELDQYLQHCTDNGLFNSIERLAMVVGNLQSLIQVSQRCPTLRRIDLIQQPGGLPFTITDVNYQQLRSVSGHLLENGVELFVLGLLFNEQTQEWVKTVIEQLIRSCWNKALVGHMFELPLHRQEYLELEPMRTLLDSLNPAMPQKAAGSGITTILGHLKAIRLVLPERISVVQPHLRCFLSLKKIELKCPYDFDGYAVIIEFLQQHERLEVLNLELWSHSDLSFLLEFRALKELYLRCSFPIEQDVFVQLLLELKLLKRLDLLFPDGREQTELSRKELNEFIRALLAPGLCLNAKRCGKQHPIQRYQLSDGRFPGASWYQINRLEAWLDLQDNKIRGLEA